MCGIAGYSGTYTVDLLEKMNLSQAHRGPDDTGIWADEGARIGLAHRRLSIIDLSDSGHQPMADENAVLVFNGEIYNFQSLRQSLEKEGVTFQSSSDTEVILKMYARYGCDLVNHLNGIFAFALWDKAESTLFIARDHLGVKPLYYSMTESGFLFASEMKALIQAGDLKKVLNPKALHYYLSYLWCPAPHTMIKSVVKLEPGHCMVIKDGSILKKWQFYDLPYDTAPRDLSVTDAISRLQQDLETSVKSQMVSDVPVGALLSGGLDSSAIVSEARRYCSDFQCFTIGFRDNRNAKEGFADDLFFARKVAKHLGVKLATVYVGHEMAERLEEMIWHLDEPQADPAPLNVLFISELARSNGIKVLLSGAGGDDFFSGYRRHHALAYERWWAWLPRPFRTMIRKTSGSLFQDRPVGRRLARAFMFADYLPDQRLAGYFHWMPPLFQSSLYSEALRQSLSGESFSEPLMASLSKISGQIPALNKMLYLEAKHFLADHNLNYTDKMGMAAGVEIRVPLLDLNLVRHACELPVECKLRKGQGKWLFKKAMEGRLPQDVIYRPKTGFGAPLRHWLKDELRELVDETLSREQIVKRNLFDYSRVRQMIQMDRNGKADFSYPIFALVCMEIWFRRFMD